MFNLRIAIRIFIFLLITQGSLCLSNVHVVVPEAVERGSKVEMKCLYDLEQEVLYSVKWYRGDREFCRYSPRDVPPLKIFRIPGIEVDVWADWKAKTKKKALKIRQEACGTGGGPSSRQTLTALEQRVLSIMGLTAVIGQDGIQGFDKEASDAERLTIQAATQTASGRYTCEVSADAPSFQTAQVHTHMYVVVLPKSGPSMHGLKRRYRPGMKLKVECISRHSLPAANLSFFINNDAALSQHVLHRVDGETVGGPMTAYSTIQFVVQKHHFVRGKIKIRCTASIYSIYLQSLEKSAEEERIRTTPISLPEVHEAVVYSIHRLPETNGCNISGSASTTVKIILLLTYLLPNVIR